MDRTRKVLRTLVVIAALGGLATLGAFSAFSSQADNTGNRVQTGTVTLTENDGGAALYNITNGKPNEASTPKCIRVAYSGSLDADVKLYTPSTVDATLSPHVNLLIESGTQVTPNFDCTGFVADATNSVVYNNTLSSFPTSYGTSITDYPLAATKWVSGDAVVYRVTATISNSAPNGTQGQDTGIHTLRWEAQNQ